MKGLEKCKNTQYLGEDVSVVPFRKSNLFYDQPTFTCSKSTMKTQGQCVKSVRSLQ